MTREPRRSMWPIVAVLVLLPVLYVLGVGPVFALLLNGRIEARALVTFYYPLFTTADALGLGTLLGDYIDWCIGLF